MAQITIRNIDDAVMQALRRRASAAGRSTEEEARRALSVAAGIADRDSARARLDDARQKLRGMRDDQPAEALVRAMRDQRSRRLSD